MEELLAAMENISPDCSEPPEETWLALRKVAESASISAVEMTEEQQQCESSDFESATNVALATLKNVRLCLKKMALRNKLQFNKEALVHILLLCGEHLEVNAWTSAETIREAREVVSLVCQLGGFEDLTSLLCNSDNNYKILKMLLKVLLPNLSKEKWKNFPATVVCYKYVLFHVKQPHLYDQLGDFLPMALLLIDDYQTEHRIYGLRCLHHIVMNVSHTELQWYGRAEVIYAAIENIAYVREAKLIEALYPCLLLVLQAVEKHPKRAVELRNFSRYDKALEILLQQMEMADNIDVRREYIKSLALYMEEMGVTTCRWMKSLLRVLRNYLEAPDPPEEIIRKTALKIMKLLISYTWPIINHHAESVLTLLFKVLYDITHGIDKLPENVQMEVQKEVRDCIHLLKEAGGDVVIDIIQNYNWKEICDLDLTFAISP